MAAYYNEHDAYAAQWLRNLIAAGHLPAGEVDERDIREVQASDLAGFVQCHFFAGIGVWPYALRRVGWSDDSEIWTGSCPCQPFSNAGPKGGFSDSRHLWPEWHRLITERRPSVVVGEQVASGDGLTWFDLVQADLEGSGYAAAASDLCAAGYGAAHIRQRLYFVGLGDAERARLQEQRGQFGLPPAQGGTGEGRGARRTDAPAGFVANAQRHGRRGADEDHRKHASARKPKRDTSQHHRVAGEGHGMEAGNMANAGSGGRKVAIFQRGNGEQETGKREANGLGSNGASNGTSAPMLGWSAADWLLCRDARWRPVEPGTFPLANSPSARVGRLRAYGNALDAETATAFAKAVKDILDGAPLPASSQADMFAAI